MSFVVGGFFFFSSSMVGIYGNNDFKLRVHIPPHGPYVIAQCTQCTISRIYSLHFKFQYVRHTFWSEATTSTLINYILSYWIDTLCFVHRLMENWRGKKMEFRCRLIRLTWCDVLLSIFMPRYFTWNWMFTKYVEHTEGSVNDSMYNRLTIDNQ